ncbi:flagellar-coiling protein FcpB [Leptospira sp. GIMC2001]|uniref:flagellar-coiling protein FcpB n=1 Tax=Leptospira sp. GIMC2001 TaxID=1513297 RepID=UPI00234A849E|nr:hypothetical protein [Leptospira sp. GIMC2001]WCL47861.1 hypothetical protein O4O04_11040 [Leptospira sp. GIMC2001]
MKIRYILTILSLMVVGLGAQDNTAANKAAGIDSSQESQSIIETEKQIDEAIFKLNEKLTRHTVLFKMKVRTLPFRTVLYKGKASADGMKCDIAVDQEAKDNNCLHLEVYDFIKSEDGKSERNLGPKNKQIILFYEGTNNDDTDPRKEAPRNLTRAKSRIYQYDFQIEDKTMSEIVDQGPNTQPDHNDKMELFYQHDDYPLYGTPETPSEKGVGKYLLSNVENTKSNPIRNNFKRDFYKKHIDYFDKLFTKIFDYNDRDGNKNYKKNVEVLKNSLKY